MSDSGSLLELVTGSSRRVGTYFSVLSGLTSVVIVGFPALLVAAGAPAQRPELSILIKHLEGSFHIQVVFVFGLIVLVTGIAIHPLQFTATQIMEGYWGHWRLPQRTMSRCQRMQTRRRDRLQFSADEANNKLEIIDKKLNLIDHLIETKARTLGRTRLGILARAQKHLVDQRIGPGVAKQQINKALAYYPTNPLDIMPTRLGNVLRSHERGAGKPFRLDAVVAIPYIAQIVDETVREYLDDAKSAMDLSVRMVIVWAICTLDGVLLLWRFDFWLAIPLLTYFLSWLAYRGAVSAADGYGVAMRVALTLGRQKLYELLDVEFPADLGTERRQNEDLGSLLSGLEDAEVTFTASVSFRDRAAREGDSGRSEEWLG